MTSGEVVQLFGQLRFAQDDRNPPDNRRRGQFKAGWEDATVREAAYAEQTLTRLTWHNLGYRFGQHLGHRTAALIEEAYGILAALYEKPQANGLVVLPGEIADDTLLVEGAVCRVSVNAYERNPEARRRCIAHYGTSCCICGLNFGQVYGPVAEGFIHAHHIRPLSEVGEEYTVDPQKDLRPVCPNCHAVLHRRTPAYSIDQVRAFLREAGALRASNLRV